MLRDLLISLVPAMSVSALAKRT